MVIVFNPVAGRRRAHLLWRVLDVLVANGVRLELAETCRSGHAEALTMEAVKRGERMVVAAGGDGTIAEVANGLMGTGVLGVIPRVRRMCWRTNWDCRFYPRRWRRRWRLDARRRYGLASHRHPREIGCWYRCWVWGSMRMLCGECRFQ